MKTVKWEVRWNWEGSPCLVVDSSRKKVMNRMADYVPINPKVTKYRLVKVTTIEEYVETFSGNGKKK